MQQSNVIFGFLLFAYFLFITLRGELATYITLLRGGGAQPAQTATGAGAALNLTPAVNNAVASGAASLTKNAQAELANPSFDFQTPSDVSGNINDLVNNYVVN